MSPIDQMGGVSAGAPLLQREEQLTRIESALAAARNGAGGAQLVEGPPGIGKTALLDAARCRATEEGVLVLGGRGSELEHEYGLGVVRQCLVPAMQAVAADERARVLAGAAAIAEPVVLDGASEARASTPFAMLNALYWLVANLVADGARPALLVVDDAQWADEASLRFLAFLVRRAESLALLVLIAAREETGSAGGDSPLWTLRTDPALELLRPRPLDESAVAELVGGGVAEVAPEFARACHRATGGNPFLVGQLGSALRAERVPFSAAAAARVPAITPPEVARTVRRQLAGLDPTAVGLATAVAVLGGDDVTLPEAAALADVDSVRARAAADELVEAGLLEPGLPLRFRHPLLLGAVDDAMTLAQRHDAHARAARLLADRAAPPEQQAVHLLEVEPAGSSEVVATLRAAARQAWARGAPDPAVALLVRALAEPPAEDQRYETLAELAEAEHAAGHRVQAEERASQAFERASDVNERSRILDLWSTIVGNDLSAMAALGPHVEQTLAELGDGGDRELTLRLRAQLLAAMVPDPDPDPDRLGALMAEAERLTGATPGEAAVLGIAVFHRLRDGDAADVASLAERAARQAGALMTEGADSKAFNAMAHGLKWSERLELAERLALDAIELSRREGWLPSFAFGGVFLSGVRRRQGMLREAEADARASAGVAEGWLRDWATGALAACLLDQGRADEAWAALVEQDLTGPLGPSPPETATLLARMRIRTALGDRAAALADWHEARSRLVRGSPVANWIEDYVAAAELLRADGDVGAARQLAEEALDAARAWGTSGGIGEALRGVARTGEPDDAVATLRAAVTELEASPARVVQAQALVDLGAALRRRGDRRDSRDPLREGLRLAESCSAGGVAELARAELAASGVRIAPRTPGGTDLLTPSEQRIAELAAAGSTNAEIAQSLFVTVKTVEMHLTRSYRKLGVSRRGELADALRAGDGAEPDSDPAGL